MDKLQLYSQVRSEIADGDVLLFRRGQGLVSRLISVAGRSPICHAGMAVWWGDDLMCVHTVQGRGGVVDHLSRLAEQYPGQVEVRTVNRRRYNLGRPRAVAEMKRIIGRPYGWTAIFTAALLHMPLVRWFVKPLRSDEADGELPFCSAAVARAVRAGGVDLVPNMADLYTEPGDLDRSAALKLKFVLLPDTVEGENGPTHA